MSHAQIVATILVAVFTHTALAERPAVYEDFEGFSYSWSYQLNPSGITIIDEPTNNRNIVALISLIGDDAFNWKGNPLLNRSELKFILKTTKSDSLVKMLLDDILVESIK